MTTKKKVLFLFANSAVRKGLADPDRLKELMDTAVAETGDDMEVYVSYARSLSFFISNEKTVIRDHRNHLNLEEYDFVYFRKAGSAMQQMLTAALYLKDHGVPFFDTEIGRSSSRNKLSQMYMMYRRGVPIPTTLFSRNNRRLARLVSTRYAKHFAFPLIAKATGGTRGDANYLVKSLEELNELVVNEKRHFIIQEFIPNDGDWRYFVAGGELLGVIGRKASGDSHLNNTSKGGEATLMDVATVPTNIRTDALLAARVFGRDVAGVDVIFNKETGEHSILEVNRAPQIEHASYETEKALWMVEAVRKAIETYQSPFQEGVRQDTFGRFEAVHLMHSASDETKLIAKVDTGADSSSLHATDMNVVDGVLKATIAGETYTFTSYSERKVRSSNGQWEQRYFVEVPVRIGETVYNMKVTLTDRSGMKYEMLIGRRFLMTHKLLVDVGWRFIASGKKKETR